MEPLSQEVSKNDVGIYQKHPIPGKNGSGHLLDLLKPDSLGLYNSLFIGECCLKATALHAVPMDGLQRSLLVS